MVSDPNERIIINLQTNKEYRKVKGIFFIASNLTLKKSTISLNIDQEIIFRDNIMEIHTVHLSEEAKTYKLVMFDTTVKAESSTIDGYIQCDNLAAGDNIHIVLLYEK